MADYIRRDTMIEDIDEAVKHRGMGELIGQTLKRYILRQPAADVAEVAQAKWILDRYPYLPARECSRCTIMIPRMKQVPEQFWQYCPNCGAKMDGR